MGRPTAVGPRDIRVRSVESLMEHLVSGSTTISRVDDDGGPGRAQRTKATVEPGLVPKQGSTGDRSKLSRISKRGNKCLRTLFVQAGPVIERRPAAAMRALWPWIEKVSQRLVDRHLLAIALANKLARIACAILARLADPFAALQRRGGQDEVKEEPEAARELLRRKR
jgi:transposase